MWLHPPSFNRFHASRQPQPFKHAVASLLEGASVGPAMSIPSALPRPSPPCRP